MAPKKKKASKVAAPAKAKAAVKLEKPSRSIADSLNRIWRSLRAPQEYLLTHPEPSDDVKEKAMNGNADCQAQVDAFDVNGLSISYTDFRALAQNCLLATHGNAAPEDIDERIVEEIGTEEEHPTFLKKEVERFLYRLPGKWLPHYRISKSNPVSRKESIRLFLQEMAENITDDEPPNALLPPEKVLMLRNVVPEPTMLLNPVDTFITIPPPHRFPAVIEDLWSRLHQDSSRSSGSSSSSSRGVFSPTNSGSPRGEMHRHSTLDLTTFRVFFTWFYLLHFEGSTVTIAEAAASSVFYQWRNEKGQMDKMHFQLAAYTMCTDYLPRQKKGVMEYLSACVAATANAHRKHHTDASGLAFFSSPLRVKSHTLVPRRTELDPEQFYTLPEFRPWCQNALAYRQVVTRNRIFVYGPRCVGKTTVGNALANALHAAHLDVFQLARAALQEQKKDPLGAALQQCITKRTAISLPLQAELLHRQLCSPRVLYYGYVWSDSMSLYDGHEEQADALEKFFQLCGLFTECQPLVLVEVTGEATSLQAHTMQRLAAEGNAFREELARREDDAQWQKDVAAIEAQRTVLEERVRGIHGKLEELDSVRASSAAAAAAVAASTSASSTAAARARAAAAAEAKEKAAAQEADTFSEQEELLQDDLAQCRAELQYLQEQQMELEKQREEKQPPVSDHLEEWGEEEEASAMQAREDTFLRYLIALGREPLLSAAERKSLTDPQWAIQTRTAEGKQSPTMAADALLPPTRSPLTLPSLKRLVDLSKAAHHEACYSVSGASSDESVVAYLCRTAALRAPSLPQEPPIDPSLRVVESVDGDEELGRVKEEVAFQTIGASSSLVWQRFCPVTYAEELLLMEGAACYSCVFENRFYCLASQANVKKFMDNPTMYLRETPVQRQQLFLLADPELMTPQGRRLGEEEEDDDERRRGGKGGSRRKDPPSREHGRPFSGSKQKRPSKQKKKPLFDLQSFTEKLSDYLLLHPMTFDKYDGSLHNRREQQKKRDQCYLQRIEYEQVEREQREERLNKRLLLEMKNKKKAPRKSLKSDKKGGGGRKSRKGSSATSSVMRSSSEHSTSLLASSALTEGGETEVDDFAEGDDDDHALMPERLEDILRDGIEKAKRERRHGVPILLQLLDGAVNFSSMDVLMQEGLLPEQVVYLFRETPEVPDEEEGAVKGRWKVEEEEATDDDDEEEEEEDGKGGAPLAHGNGATPPKTARKESGEEEEEDMQEASRTLGEENLFRTARGERETPLQGESDKMAEEKEGSRAPPRWTGGVEGGPPGGEGRVAMEQQGEEEAVFETKQERARKQDAVLHCLDLLSAPPNERKRLPGVPMQEFSVQRINIFGKDEAMVLAEITKKSPTVPSVEQGVVDEELPKEKEDDDEDEQDEEEEDENEEEEEEEEEEGEGRPVHPPLRKLEKSLRPVHRFPHQFGSRLMFCPVSLVERGLLIQGRLDLCLKYQEELYCFATEEAMQTFSENPLAYVGDLPPRHIPPRMWLIGPPGSGKKTLAKGLEGLYGCPAISYSRTFIEEVIEAAELGEEASTMVSGVCIPGQKHTGNPYLKRASALLKEVREFAASQALKRKQRKEAEAIFAKREEEEERRAEAGEEEEETPSDTDDQDDHGRAHTNGGEEEEDPNGGVWDEAREQRLQEWLEFEGEEPEDKAARLQEAYLRMAGCVTRFAPFEHKGYFMIMPAVGEAELDYVFEEGGIPELVMDLQVTPEVLEQRARRSTTAAGSMRGPANGGDTEEGGGRRGSGEESSGGPPASSSASPAPRAGFIPDRDWDRLWRRKARALQRWRRRHIGTNDPSEPLERGEGGREQGGRMNGGGATQERGDGSGTEDRDAEEEEVEEERDPEELMEEFMEGLEERRIRVMKIRNNVEPEAALHRAKQKLAKHLENRLSFFCAPEILFYDTAMKRLTEGNVRLSPFDQEDPVRWYDIRQGLRRRNRWKPLHGLAMMEEDRIEVDANGNILRRIPRQKPTRGLGGGGEGGGGRNVGKSEEDAFLGSREAEDGNEFGGVHDDDDGRGGGGEAAANGGDRRRDEGELEEEEEELSELDSVELDESRERLERRRRKEWRRQAPRAVLLYHVVYFFESDATLQRFLKNPLQYIEQPPPSPHRPQAPVLVMYEDDQFFYDESDGVKKRPLAESVAYNLGYHFISVSKLLSWGALHPVLKTLGQECMQAALAGSVPDHLVDRLLVARLQAADVKRDGAVLLNLPCTSSQYHLLQSNGCATVVKAGNFAIGSAEKCSAKGGGGERDGEEDGEVPSPVDLIGTGNEEDYRPAMSIIGRHLPFLDGEVRHFSSFSSSNELYREGSLTGVGSGGSGGSSGNGAVGSTFTAFDELAYAFFSQQPPSASLAALSRRWTRRRASPSVSPPLHFSPEVYEKATQVWQWSTPILEEMAHDAMIELPVAVSGKPWSNANLNETVQYMDTFMQHERQAIVRTRRAYPINVENSYHTWSHLQNNLSEYGWYCPYCWVQHSNLVYVQHDRPMLAAEFMGKYYFFKHPRYLERFLKNPSEVTDPTLIRPLPSQLPVPVNEVVRREELECQGCCPVVLYDSRREKGLRGVRQPTAEPGALNCVVRYDGKLYALKNRDHRTRFLMCPWVYLEDCALPAPRKCPLTPEEVRDGISHEYFIRRELYDAVVYAMLAVSTHRPRYPGLTTTESSLKFMALHMKAENKAHNNPIQTEQYQANFEIYKQRTSLYRDFAGVSLVKQEDIPRVDELCEVYDRMTHVQDRLDMLSRLRSHDAVQSDVQKLVDNIKNSGLLKVRSPLFGKEASPFY